MFPRIDNPAIRTPLQPSCVAYGALLLLLASLAGCDNERERLSTLALAAGVHPGVAAELLAFHRRPSSPDCDRALLLPLGDVGGFEFDTRAGFAWGFGHTVTPGWMWAVRTDSDYDLYQGRQKVASAALQRQSGNTVELRSADTAITFVDIGDGVYAEAELRRHGELRRRVEWSASGLPRHLLARDDLREHHIDFALDGTGSRIGQVAVREAEGMTAATYNFIYDGRGRLLSFDESGVIRTRLRFSYGETLEQVTLGDVPMPVSVDGDGNVISIAGRAGGCHE